MTARTSMDRSARTIRTRVRLIPKAVFIVRPRGAKRSYPTWDMSPWRTGMGWPWPGWSLRLMAALNDTRPRPCSKPSARRPDGASREDKAYDTSDHVAALRAENVTAHVAQNNSETKTGKQRR